MDGGNDVSFRRERVQIELNACVGGELNDADARLRHTDVDGVDDAGGEVEQLVTGVVVEARAVVKQQHEVDGAACKQAAADDVSRC